MGTNYYFCPDLFDGTDLARIHIGKSSSGWCFSLHVYPDGGIKDWDDWLTKFGNDGWHIMDECGCLVTISNMINTVTNRSGRPWEGREWFGYRGEWEFHQENHSMRGPNGMLRHQISTLSGCISHGAGTWDCFISDFS